MGRIQTNIGLITGMPIGDTVDKLMELAAKPRKMLEGRNKTLVTEQTGLTELMALLASVQYVARNLGKDAPYNARIATSSDSKTLAATVAGTPAFGSWQFTPLRSVQNQQWLSSGVRSRSEPIGAGQLSFRFGDTAQRDTPLEYLNGGGGFVRGKIRVTDRSGASAEIDLSTAQTVDDVLEAINSNSTVRVTATAHGDSIRLTDGTGQTAANLQVQEVGGGRTAESLGLDAVNIAAAVADGRDLLYLFDTLSLDALNDGNGVAISSVLSDIEYTLRDGTTGTIDLSPILSGSSEVDHDVTLGDVIQRFNAAAPDKLKLEIAPDGDRLVVTDLTMGAGTFQLTSANGSGALDDLGLAADSVGNTITGRRLLSGTRDVLLASLNGGKGLGTLGTLNLTDRSGATDTVDLATAETLGEVIHRINAATVNITARVNRAGNGIELLDTSGQTGNLVVANGDATDTAGKLGIGVNAAVGSVNSGDLHLQVVSENTLLADLNGRGGVAKSSFTVVDSTGAKATVNLSSSDVRTLGDAIRRINQTGLSVRAEINARGDGIALRDTGQGSGKLTVVEGSSTTAADLHLLRNAVTTDEEGIATQTIDGSTTHTFTWDNKASLGDVAGLIKNLGAGVSASILADGSAHPYRLSIASQRPGRAGGLVIDTSQATFSLDESIGGQDALLLMGGEAASGVLVSGPSNTFTDLLDGVRLEIKQGSSQPVTVTVAQSDTDFVASVKMMVDNYNKFRKRLSELTAYDPATDKRSALTGDATAARLDSDLSYLLSGRVGSGTVRSLGELGVSLNSDGTLGLDEAKLKAKFAETPDAVKQFFTAENVGFADKLDTLLEQASGASGSLLASRLDALEYKISQNEERIQAMNKRLDTQRERLLMDFYRMETAIGKLQNNMSAISSIQYLKPYWSSTS